MRVKLSVLGVLVVLLAAVSGCSDTPTSAASTPGYSQTDVRPGAGSQIASGNLVTLQYTGWLYDPARTEQKGLQFDTSRSSVDPFSFTVGAGQVISGFDQGVVGMRVGGLRRLVIPPSLAYGTRRQGAIPPNATLVFDVEVISFQ